LSSGSWAARAATRLVRAGSGGAAATRTAADDEVVVEEPLAIRVGGDTLAVTMRTPGHDRELVMGFLLAEGVIASRADVSALAHCGRTGADERENTIEVTLAPGVKTPLDEVDAPFARRGTMTTSACGVCGRRVIDDLLARVRAVPDGGAVSHDVVAAAAAALRERQPLFARTGGCHAASLVTTSGEHVATFEDVGRHNAVDKLVGSRLIAGELPLSAHLMIVSGRASFEIVQKAVAAGIRIVASISAPSSLAIDLAVRANLTLAGFVRGDALTVYSGAPRLVS